MLVELLLARRVGEHVAGVLEESLVLVAQEVQKLLGVRARVAKGRGGLREDDSLVGGSALLASLLHVHPVDLSLHHVDGLVLRDGPQVQRDGERDGKVDDAREAVVHEDGSERPDGHDAAPCVVGPEGVVAAVGLEVDGHGRHEVEAPRRRALGQIVPVEVEGGKRAQQAAGYPEPLRALHGLRLALDPRQGLRAVVAHAGELRDCRVDVVRLGGEGQVPLPLQVRDALAHLVVEDAVVLLDVVVQAGVALWEERPVADLLGRHGLVGDRDLDAGVRVEVVVERAHCAVDVLAGVLPGALVGDVAELHHLAEEAWRYLGDPVLEHELVSAEVDGALLPLLLLLLLLRGAFDALPTLLQQAHRAPPPFGRFSFFPCGSASSVPGPAACPCRCGGWA